MRKPAGRRDKKIFKHTAAKGKDINLYPRIYRGGIRF